jgi:hypothetical protein
MIDVALPPASGSHSALSAGGIGMTKLLKLSIIAIALISSSVLAQISKKEYPEVTDTAVISPYDVFPPDFKGKITYNGLYRGKVFGAATNYRTLPMAGEYIVVVEFDGKNISGSMRTIDRLSGVVHGTPDPGRFMGNRDGATCHLSWADGSDSVAYCGRTEYRENVNNQSVNANATMAYAAKGRTTETVDYAGRASTISPTPNRLSNEPNSSPPSSSISARSAILNVSTDASSLPIVDRDKIPPLSGYKPKEYDVLVFKNRAWRLANPTFFNLSDMFDCRPNGAMTAWLCQVDENNGYRIPFIVQISGHFRPRSNQLKQINGADILIGAITTGILMSGGPSKPSDSSFDEYAHRCRSQGKEPGGC